MLLSAHFRDSGLPVVLYDNNEHYLGLKSYVEWSVFIVIFKVCVFIHDTLARKFLKFKEFKKGSSYHRKKDSNVGLSFNHYKLV